ncbi:hypothetical protein ACAG24_019165 [Mycobacterium sp. pW049]|uniref:hypothetical protein n=1 Tax=[Mycobacterium] bulgaricum TaxID=3238985 RepID=UPI00351BEA72
MNPKRAALWAVLIGIVAIPILSVACDEPDEAQQPPAAPMITMPNVAGMTTDQGQAAIMALFANANIVVRESSDSIQQRYERGCRSYPPLQPAGHWMIAANTLAGRPFAETARFSETLFVDPPADAPCDLREPVAPSGPMPNADLPNVNVPDVDKPWICSRTRWC